VDVAGILPEPAEPPDFDTRPGEPLRSTIPLWIQSCWRCGYAADDISAAPPGMAAIVDSEAYRQWLLDEAIPSKAREFLCYGFILEKHHQFADAGWSALHAAWVCDDDTADEAGFRCRARAVELWQRGKQAGQLFCDDMASEFALVTDVYRRMSEFEHATVACAEGLDLEDISPAIEAMLRRQSVLIQRRDVSAHSMRELLASPRAGSDAGIS
jgi:hypothetical protein